LAKRISEKQKIEILEDFINEKTIDEISKKFNFTKLTISRNLKKSLGNEKYFQLIKISKIVKNSTDKKQISDHNHSNSKESSEAYNQDSFSESSFVEIAPLDYEIEKAPDRDFSSVPIAEVDLPKVVYMVVDKQIELETKLLKDYAVWSFLPEKDLNRNTIEIFFEIKVAKRFSNKDQKVIKVPNSDVLRVAAPILVSKGISRIVSPETLIAL
tara:strand:- start:2964 stop:3602 length:639 start_codon:yes stop_codon:yes gene_type:complete